MKNYDIVEVIHGHADKLEQLRQNLVIKKTQAAYSATDVDE